MNIRLVGRVQNEREKAYDNRSRGGEQRMKKSKHMSIQVEEKAQNKERKCMAI
jgi:hypothetical protein